MSRIKDAAKTIYFRGKRLLERSGSTRATGDLSQRERNILATLKRRGLVIIEDYYDGERCRLVRQEMDRIFSEYRDKIWRDPLESDNRAYAAETVSEAIHEYYSDPFINKLAKASLGETQSCFFTLANRVVPKAGNLGSGMGWHRDTVHERQFKSILYVSDVGEDNGPFEYVPNSHRVRSIVGSILNSGIRFGQSRFEDSDIHTILKKCSLESVRILGKAGTLVLADTGGLHRGSPIAEGARYALTNYFFSTTVIEAHQARGKFVSYFVNRGESAMPAEREM